MFFINVKEAFQQHILDVLIVLTIVYFGALIFSVVIKWIQPHLKKNAKMYNDVGLEDSHDGFKKISWSKWNKKKTTEVVCNYDSSDSDSCTDEDNLNVFESIKSIFDTSNLLTKYSKRNTSKNKVIEELALRIENAVFIRKLLKNKLKSNKNSSEVQTNITISPKVKVDYNACPTFILSQPASDIPLQVSISSDDFESAESGDDEDYYMPIFRQLGCCDILKRKRLDSDGHFKCVSQKTTDNKCGALSNSENRDFTLKGYKDCAGHENKMLQLAINEFEKELKPIRDQIKELKDCLIGCEDNYRGISFNLPSDTSSSLTETTKQSEVLSEPSSTTSSSNLHYNIVSSFMVSEHHSSKGLNSNLKSQASEKMKNLSRPLNITIKKVKPSRTIKISDDEINKEQPMKHSPLADMYIQLSHCNIRSLRRESDRKNVTCHINLNVNLESSSVTGLVNPTRSKDRNIISPLLSEPEDIAEEQADIKPWANQSNLIII